uniref:Hyaluronidase-like protein n=1 Tax=Glyptapanteles indiensis TaxID=92994 RepID=B7S912_GLYIN|nr:hyaluronidase-like protein [Glyptapanteles indiensis]
MCHKYGMYFDDLEKFGIIQNTDDHFRGEKITILYDPGMFLALIKNPNGERPQPQNPTKCPLSPASSTNSEPTYIQN